MSDDRASKIERWEGGDAYEAYVGRWSRLVGARFVEWLSVPAGGRWLDVGCGTGALSETILRLAHPHEVRGIDRSEAYVEYAQAHIRDPRATFGEGDALALPVGDDEYDAVVSGLALNFVPDAAAAVREMARVARPGGVVGAYVWDYAEAMQMIRFFWDAAVAANPAANDLDQGRRFPICQPEPLAALFTEAGLSEVETQAIEIPTRFASFDDYWTPFTNGPGSAPRYAMSLGEAERAALRDSLRSHLPIQPDESIHLTARAWAVRGTAAKSARPA